MSHFINNAWIEGTGTPFCSTNPATGQPVFETRAGTSDEIDRAIAAARSTLPSWSSLAFDQRVVHVEAFTRELKEHGQQLSEAISLETGKPHWEAAEELAAMVNKAPISITAYRQRRQETSAALPNGSTAETRFKPHGVVAVFGPFNFPGHLPNGHIIPALLAGNTVVFKPSEYTPLVGRRMAELWEASRLPSGVVNVVQGGRQTGVTLAQHPGIDGIFFTGSVNAGLSLHRAVAGQPQKILALELGGNNPLIAWDFDDLDAAVTVIVLSAFLTSGQRCTCARRLIVPTGADALLNRLQSVASQLIPGPFTQSPEPFMGPVISASAALQLLDAQERLQHNGGQSMLSMKQLHGSPAMLTPGIMDVTSVIDRPDIELFGPFLQVIRVNDFEHALAEANSTSYGLAAGLISNDRARFEQFFAQIRAGVVSWNRPTTGASGSLPFGGLGQSGNHRPSGYYAVDYCSDPVAILQSPRVGPLGSLPPGFIL